MKTRLTLFALALLLLPPAAVLLAGLEWPAPVALDGSAWLPALLALAALAALTHALDSHSFRRSGNSLLRSQWHYMRWLAAAGAVLGALIAYLDLYVALWLTPFSTITALLLAALCGAVALPAVLVIRLWLAGTFRLTRRIAALPALPPETSSALALLAAAVGLLGGPVWPVQLAWLYWSAPLLLLIALQVLWHESSVLSGVKQGDWSRVLLGSIAGMFTGAALLGLFRLAGGTILLTAALPCLLALFAVFGLLCLQLGDAVAENWRGKTRGEVFKRKPFPIPIVTKK